MGEVKPFPPSAGSLSAAAWCRSLVVSPRSQPGAGFGPLAPVRLPGKHAFGQALLAVDSGNNLCVVWGIKRKSAYLKS